MKNFLCATTALCFCFTLGCSTDTPQEMAEKAEQQYQKGDYAHALKTYQDFQKKYGETPESWQNVALAAYQSKDYAYAARAAQTGLHVISTTGETSEAIIERQDVLTEILAMAREGEGNLEEAIRLYYDLMNAPTKSVRISAKSRLANCFLEQNKEDAALAFLLSALKDDASSPLTNYNLAKLCNENFKLYNLAKDFYSMAHRLLPENSIQKKIAASEIERLETSHADVRATPPSQRNVEKSKKAIAESNKALQGKKYKTAENQAKVALDADPSSYEAARNLITIATHKNVKNNAVAMDAYFHAVSLRPNDLELRMEAATFAKKIKRNDEQVATLLRPVLLANPKYRDGIYQMMSIMYHQKKLDTARAWGEYYLSIDAKATNEARDFIKDRPMYVK